MTAFVANEMSGLTEAGRIVDHRKIRREVADDLLFWSGRRTGNEGTGGNVACNEWRDIMGRCSRYNRH